MQIRLTPAIALLAATTLLSAFACSRKISGQYLATNGNGLCWLQIVRTPDSRVTGQLVTMLISQDGKIGRRSTELTGVSDGSNIVLSSTGLLDHFTLSGDLKHDRLTLTGAQPSSIVLDRSDLSEYENAAASLSRRSQEILAEETKAQERRRAIQAQQDLLSEIDRMVQRVRQFVAEADVALNRFPAISEKFLTLTAKMKGYVNAERGLEKDPNAAPKRGDLALAVSQASSSTEELRSSLESFASSLKFNSQSMIEEGATLDRSCNVPPNSELTAQEVEARTRACNQLSEAESVYRGKLGAVTAGLAKVNEVSTREHTTQQALLQSSQRLE